MRITYEALAAVCHPQHTNVSFSSRADVTGQHHVLMEQSALCNQLCLSTRQSHTCRPSALEADMSAPLNTAPVSRIGKGRLPDSGPSTGPELPATAATPDAVKTARVADQAAMASSQNLNSTITPAVMTPDPASTDQQQAPSHTSKWGKSSASEGGPVFQVVSRNARTAAGTPSSYTPPSHPTKTHATAPRTRSLAPSRSTASSSSSIASISLRRSTSSTSSNDSPMAFGSRADRPAGRLATDGSKGNPTPPLAGSCKSLVRMLSFDEAAQSPGIKRSGFAASIAASAVLSADNAPTAPADGFQSRGGVPAEATTADAGTSALSSTLATAPDSQPHHISSGPATWLPGCGCSSPLQDLERSCPGRPTAAALRVGFGPLPDVHDAKTATTAAQLLLQQLLDSASSITAAAGLSADSLSVAALSATSAADGGNGGQRGSTEGQVSACDSAVTFGNQCGFDVLVGKAAVMLEAGCRADDVRQTVLPALLLQLAGMACDHSNSNSSFSSDPASSAAAGQDTGVAVGSEAGAAAAAAAGALKAGVKAGVVAAKAAMSPLDPCAGAVNNGATAVPAASISVAAHRRGGLGWRAAGACLLLVSGMALWAVGFVVAIAWTVLEGGSAWVNSSKDMSTASGIGHDGVDWPVEWLFNGRVGSDVWGGAVLAGRRFAA